MISHLLAESLKLSHITRGTVPLTTSVKIITIPSEIIGLLAISTVIGGSITSLLMRLAFFKAMFGGGGGGDGELGPIGSIVVIFLLFVVFYGLSVRLSTVEFVLAVVGLIIITNLVSSNQQPTESSEE
jgi:hypothetical protein